MNQVKSRKHTKRRRNDGKSINELYTFSANKVADVCLRDAMYTCALAKNMSTYFVNVLARHYFICKHCDGSRMYSVIRCDKCKFSEGLGPYPFASLCEAEHINYVNMQIHQKGKVDIAMIHKWASDERTKKHYLSSSPITNSLFINFHTNWIAVS